MFSPDTIKSSPKTFRTAKNFRAPLSARMARPLNWGQSESATNSLLIFFSGDIETQDTNDENEQRKKVIIAVSVAAVAAVVLCSLILCLFHTGILSTRLVKVA